MYIIFMVELMANNYLCLSKILNGTSLKVKVFFFFCIQYTYYVITRKLNMVYTLQIKGKEINSVAINLSPINYLNTLKPIAAAENNLYLSDTTIPIYT